MSEEKQYNEDMRELVPGTTAGPLSPGTTAYPAGSPAPIFFGAAQPMEQPPVTGQGIPFTGAPMQPGFQPGAAQIPAPGLGLQRPTPEDYMYTQGYLATQIGRNMRVQFLIGESLLVDRRGTLLQVGIDYIVLREAESDDLVVCDLYSIKFAVTYL
jgi:hypothetical protein